MESPWFNGNFQSFSLSGIRGGSYSGIGIYLEASTRGSGLSSLESSN